MLSDSIADMLTRIRNGYLAHKEEVSIPYANQKKAIAEVMLKNEYIESYRLEENGNKKDLYVKLLYKQDKPAITKIIRVSKTGRRMYAGKKRLPFVLSGLGRAIVTTSKGVMTDHDARRMGLGGEIICKIW
ncbi:30S ribosomal protein S8 [Candidatus Beckwithbacteria bacterium CG23_combo_of_CG06-09_8_20_14_all_34_8]|uniref:Small ribosomal subunit protein uS8 n=1 Tax=Candidatus Beckwithbacteria bacterium CG23_combo_of_CG06-09_8_20_14_all_34_8 TaxID=1974497 RepID=A0A2H0B6T4_9BACT|nr:MAG: 30S ribosomal protein S8 [Candidatus Beckwithbacteria bacterium CG23_combo_of_CG06-09_8_20_14_all_34_8]